MSKASKVLPEGLKEEVVEQEEFNEKLTSR